ncbi:unnamed protein product [Mycena citricolor]|uniref:Uncharacterized protein n=1 Tax=Mycena citricolor TaxID=2018698 RepID=A0AAD2HHN8_9AGAR|nr:unnamed protein product [Mycena citricolor]
MLHQTQCCSEVRVSRELSSSGTEPSGTPAGVGSCPAAAQRNTRSGVRNSSGAPAVAPMRDCVPVRHSSGSPAGAVVAPTGPTGSKHLTKYHRRERLSDDRQRSRSQSRSDS